MTGLTEHEGFSIVGNIPQSKDMCEYIDQWTGSVFHRVVNQDFVGKFQPEGKQWIPRGWVYRGGTHIPPVVWHQGSEAEPVRFASGGLP